MAKPFMRLKIDVTKIDKTAIFVGKSGKYIDLTIMLNDALDKYGNCAFITQDIGKERRAAGERGPIVGNARNVEGAGVPVAPKPKDEDDECPF